MLQVYSARKIHSEKIVTGEDLANAIIGPPAVYIPDLVQFLDSHSLHELHHLKIDSYLILFLSDFYIHLSLYKIPILFSCKSRKFRLALAL